MHLDIYTDGACKGNPGPGGWGAVILFEDGNKYGMSGFERDTTNNQMELLAVMQSLLFAKNHGATSVTIYSDSAYVVNAIKYGWLTQWHNRGWKTQAGEPVKNQDMWKEVFRYFMRYDFMKIKFVKVKGHSGNKYNEEADKLARNEVETNC